MNGDEAMAYGSALRAANLSIALRMKQLHFYDDSNYETKIVVSTPEKGVIFKNPLFSKESQHGEKVFMNFP